jgi:hypothetical protein
MDHIKDVVEEPSRKERGKSNVRAVIAMLRLGRMLDVKRWKDAGEMKSKLGEA